MCGICGAVTSDSLPPISEAALVAMRDTLTHRGPDDAGHYSAPHIALGSRRLAILDLSPNGHMPMTAMEGRYTIVYNGEVYNYREFRSELEAKGYTFRSHSDTETLLYLYIEYGPTMLDRLIGMFALAIWDKAEKTLFIARDRLGVKPLVYAFQHQKLYFASEEKALLKAGISPEIDEDRQAELLYFRYISGENTVFKHIKNLLPGHYLIWKDGTIQICQYWHLQERALALRGTIPNPVEWYREKFESAVRYRLISDVPVGVLLSGGLDSSTVGTVSGRQSPHITSFTIRFDDRFHDEGELARQVADQNALRYHELYISGSSELPQLIKDASWLLDAPLTHGNDPHILAISRYAKKHVTVLLSGEGGDETLGGYVRYRPLQQPAALLNLARLTLPFINPLLADQNRLLKPRLKKLQRFLRQGGIDDLILYNSCDVLPVDVSDLGGTPGKLDLSYRHKILSEAKALYPNEPIRQAMYLDQHTFLQSLLTRNDRMTMGASIECRVPFLDHRLVEGTAALETSSFIHMDKSKWLLREAFGAELPSTILSHRKVGLSVPWEHYMRATPDFVEHVDGEASIGLAQLAGLTLPKAKAVVSEFISGDNEHIQLIRQMMLFGIWKQELVKRNVSPVVD